MNALNRAVTLIVLTLILILIIAMALSPNEVLSWMQMTMGKAVVAVSHFQQQDVTNFNIARIAAVVAALILLVPLIMAEFPRSTESLVRFRTPEGEAQVTTDSIERRLAWHVDQLADVIAVQPQVQARGDQVDITLDVDTTPEIDVPMKTEEIMLVTREIVEDSMGLKIGKLAVNIRHTDYPELT